MRDWYEKTHMGALVDRAAHLFGPREALYHDGKRWTFDPVPCPTDGAPHP